MTDPLAALHAAADRLLAAFAGHDRDAYFAAFAEDATFFFHALAEPLESRAAYEKLWRQWEEEDGFRVLACTATGRQVHLHGDVGILTHHVLTTVSALGSQSTMAERETIVFRRNTAGDWLAIHEHLSLET